MTAILKAGRYEIVGELGRGAMGVVYKATDPVIGRPVAVKTIKLSEQGTGLTRAELIARFQTEARAAGLLTHHNIVVVYDAGEEDGLFYITMELVEGKSLQTLIDAGHAFPLPRVLRIMEQACNALQFAHENNIVHRDIKPANIMLTGDDTVKVTDFGTAKILQFGTVQQTAHVMGTPSYMSPEQVKGRAVDGRTDVFSLGVMLYEMITGEKPFPGESITTVIYKIVNEEPVPPRTIDPTIHPGISASVLRALAKEPEDRYQSCHEFLEDLRNYRSISSEANSRATVASLGNRNAAPNATVAINPGLRGLTAENPQMTPGRTPGRRSTDNFAEPFNASPMQTPVLRRTDHIPPYEPPKEKSIVWTVLAAIVMVAVIGFGAYKLKPVLYDMRHPEVRNEANSAAGAAAGAAAAAANAPAPSAVETSTPSAEAPTATKDSAQSAATPPQDANAPAATNANSQSANAQPESSAAEKSDSQQNAAPSATETATVQKDSKATQPTQVAASEKIAIAKAPEKLTEKIEVAPSKKIEAAKTAPVLTAKAAQVKQTIDDALADRGLTGKASVQGVGNTLTITGKLRPQQHSALLNLLHDVPAGVRIVDNIGDDSSAPAPSRATPAPSGAAPATSAVPAPTSAAPAASKGAGNSDSLGAEVVKPTGVKVAWADVKSFPVGAEIFLDDRSTGQTTPARVQVPSGVHVVTLHLEGFKDIRRGFDVSDGGTIEVRGLLRRH
ncbi:MAG TPA: protein kinase [Candidatus Acidoferrum sp.]|jgi:serine/threonine protein kinase